MGGREKEGLRKIHGFWFHNWFYRKRRVMFEERQ